MQLTANNNKKTYKMNRKISLFARSIIVFSMLITSCVTHVETSNDKGSAFTISQVASSTTSITISWPGNSTLDYIVKVYRDANLQDLYQEYSILGYEVPNNKFTIPYLDCKQPYYVVVENSDGSTSTPLIVELEENVARRNIVSLNFDQLHWGYDYVNSACGVRLDNKIALSSYNIDNLADAYEDSILATKAGEDGGLLFGCSASMKRLLEVENWTTSTKNSVYIRPGYVKLGNAYAIGSLESPKFEVLGEKSVSADISFEACLFSTSESSTPGKIIVEIIKDGTSNSIWSKEITLESSATEHSWKRFEYTVENISADCHFKVSTTANSKQACFDNLKITEHHELPQGHIYGYVSDKSTGVGIEGVAISDGFSVVLTDKEGYYELAPHSDTWYIYYSTPADCQVLVGGNGLPRFFTSYSKDKKEYNFTLRKLPGGKEKKFALFTLGDVQVSSNTGFSRFTKEAVPGIAKYVATMDIPCYGITLGDVVSNSDSKNSTAFMEKMREAMHYKKIGMPVFQVMGNHDANWFDKDNPIEPNDRSSTFEVRAQRDFEITFGPINYSFNRGDVHIVGMRDIVYRTDTTMTKYHSGFLKEQYEWLKADLNAVPDKQNKIVVLCVHIPLHQNYSSGAFTRDGGYYGYIKETFDELNEFKEAHIMSGHTHILRNYEPTKTHNNVYDHNIGAVCGAWWASNLCGDGTPNGYGVFIGEGNRFSDWYYMGYHDGMDSREYQLRLYRGNAITGAAKEDNKNGKEGYYKFNFADDVILANVFNSDSQWEIKVYEDGKYSGKMEKITPKKVSVNNLIGDGSFNTPYQIMSGTVADYDMWLVGWHLGKLDRYDTKDKTASNGTWNQVHHMYQYKLKNKNAKVEVHATDRFGRTYKTSTFVDYRDNDLIKKP